MRTSLVVAMIAMGIAAYPAKATPRRELTPKEAFSLLQAYLGPPEANWGLDFQDNHDGFYMISMINPAPGAEGFDMYDIDRRTGDLWRSSVCEHVSNTRFHAAQHRLWRRIGLTAADYRRLKRPGGQCRYE